MIKLRIFLLPSNRFLCQQRNIECEAFQFAIAIQTYDSKLIFRINPWLQPSRYWFKCRLQARILFLIYFDREMSIKLLFRSAFEKFFFHFPKEFSFSSLLKFFCVLFHVPSMRYIQYVLAMSRETQKWNIEKISELSANLKLTKAEKKFSRFFIEFSPLLWNVSMIDWMIVFSWQATLNNL